MYHSTQIHSMNLANDKEAEYLAGWKRERAEFENYRRRMTAEKEAGVQRQRMSVVQPLLDVADNFKSVVRHVPEEIKDNPWTQGVLHVMRQFEQLLEEQGVTLIEEVDVPFEPSLHEAIETVADEDKESGQVVEVLQAGYKMGESVLRPAKVKIVE